MITSTGFEVYRMVYEDELMRGTLHYYDYDMFGIASPGYAVQVSTKFTNSLLESMRFDQYHERINISLI